MFIKRRWSCSNKIRKYILDDKLLDNLHIQLKTTYGQFHLAIMNLETREQSIVLGQR